MGLVSWMRTTRLLPCILGLLRCAETAFDTRMAKSETKGEKCRTAVSGVVRSSTWQGKARLLLEHAFWAA